MKNVFFTLVLLAGIFFSAIGANAQPGYIITIAGNDTSGFSGDGSPATACELSWPSGMFVDNYGNLYIADNHNHCVRKVNTSGTITTVAGIGGVAGYSGDGGPATSANLSNIQDVNMDNVGNLYIADAINNCIRKVDTSGIITTFAGTTSAGYSGDGGPATAAQLNWPSGIVADNLNNIYIADYWNYCIRKINTAGIITTIAGNDTAGYSGDGGPISYRIQFT